ncbi:MAG: site-specific DNA-methyltransferase, partial [Sphingomonadaceae bacterium]|nr:site-specific DNA-methyltransferase [Sphingomonadaceae bacterium]
MRVEHIGAATLYLGDCREIAPTLGGVDVTITDPPYGDVTHRGARTGAMGGEVLINFASITDGQFRDDCAMWVDITARWVVMTCEWRHAATLEASGLPLVRLGVWVKPNGAPQFTGDRPGTGWEAIAILHRSGRKRWNGGGHHAVWDVPKISGEHPTQKPLPLVSKWVEDFSDEGETVFDPFMGSGTTGVAASRLGRRFVGVELDPAHFDTACRRIEAAQKQADLFVAPPKPSR